MNSNHVDALHTRVDALRRRVVEKGATAALITAPPDIRWACGFSGSNSVLLVRQADAHFMTDGRYGTQARDEVRGAGVHVPGYQLLEHIAEQGWVEDGEVVCFQADNLSFARSQRLFALFPNVDWQGIERLVEPLAAIKEEQALAPIRAAQALSEHVLEQLVNEVIQPGITEQAVAAEIVYRHLQAGAEGMAFDCIVASGPNSALPHAMPTSRVFKKGDILTLDFGCVVDGYCSDMTRTFAIGEITAEAEEVYHLVNKARSEAIRVAKAGMTSKALDHVARSVIEEGGYGPYFSHSLGHGVGLRIHEWPMVSYRSDDILPEGAVVTIEPGIYVPDRFGIRIEDMIWLTDGGNERLTQFPDSLIVI